MNAPQLARLRWAVRGVLLLGIAASVVANILHAADNPISRTISAWPPLALLLTVELISRIPIHSRRLAVARVAATTTIAGIAAWVSYWHMVEVAKKYGETDAAPYLLPISVDGLIVVASICLVELSDRAKQLSERVIVVRGEIAATPAHVPVKNRIVTPPADPRPDLISEPPAKPRAKRARPRSLTAAQRVAKAHEREPKASHERIAELAKVSVSTAKRHRPNGSSSRRRPAETPTASGSRQEVMA